MKKIVALSLAIASTTAVADINPQRITEAKQATAFTSLGVLGVVAAGPVGLLVGAVSGAYLAEQIKKADGVEALELAKKETEYQLQQTRSELGDRALQLAQLEEAALASLQLQILFLTGSDNLTPHGKQQVLALASFLVKNPHLNIHLTGHSDPRGTDEYNDVLSYQRALGIQYALEQVGIDIHRVSVSAHGSAYSTATRGNLDSYAFDRRVEIEILKPENNTIAMSR
jgi:outer membrane protein OmpA-like peptidoglycan-associated protein